MKYLPLIPEETEIEKKALKAEIKAGQAFGKVCLGENHFFLRKKFTYLYISYSNVYRAFRRVQCVNFKIGRSDGQLQVNNIVLCSNKAELAMIDLPDEEAAKTVLKYFEENWPKVKIGKKNS